MLTSKNKNMDTNLNIEDINFEPGFNNFDVEEIETSETINAVFVIDVSPSISTYEKELNTAFNEFIDEMKGSHIADDLFVSVITFSEKIESKQGFQPVASVNVADFKATGGGTALFDAAKLGLKNAMDYRNAQNLTGVNCKTLLYIITDGWDNSSQRNSAGDVKDMHEQIMKDEANAFSFTSILFGVNQKHAKVEYTQAKEKMGIQHLAEVGVDAKEIRKMISWISSSVSSASAGGAIAAPQF